MHLQSFPSTLSVAGESLGNPLYFSEINHLMCPAAAMPEGDFS